MSETNPSPEFNIQRVYMKDASLEMPNAPQIFLEQEPPKIDVQINVDHQAIVEGISEVVVSATVTASINDKTLFLAEVKQAGIFQTANIPADQMELILGIACPSIVYPYLRANLADLIIRTGLPPVNLNEINFEAFYQQRKAQQDQPQPSLQ
ncbi:MAG: protein-export chaperone SecB [Burkholderiales bacterium]|jgi:preprotein translocase subunit SecB|nr:protein-export chaperone SecB [Burkholderiales bacterium]MCA3158397.1 protein-export chaperone SecB [Burkholderiales bacterium]MCA3161780.1 protein-export chaperone SecB [Burkholderiales bacterium]MCA3163948.1 protein-export chaperone SecB [Burkholderiales bacterium]MCA3165267.1 protein-export chaperone SecB [Burkholderiales bacterium]